MQNDNERKSSGGAAALESRIIAEAHNEANMLIEDARVRAQQLIEEGERESARIAMEAESKAQHEEYEILAKHRTQAELEAKKYALKMRHAMIDNVFQSAYRKVWELDPRDERVIRFIHRTLTTEARGGETVYPSAHHKDAVRIALSRVNDKLQQSGRPPLTMGATVPNITGGFILSAGTYTKDCSLQAIMEDARDREIVAVSKTLFDAPDAWKNPEAQPMVEPQQAASQPVAQPQQAIPQPAVEPQQAASQPMAEPQQATPQPVTELQQPTTAE